MLITFKSKAAADVVMYEEHANRILDLLHKDHKLGVITAAETANAIKLLEGEVTLSKAHVASEAIKRDILAHHGEDGDDNEHEPPQTVSFSSRAYPLLEMLRAAHQENQDVLWGV
ncbi:MAG TPA: DUF1840 domain-containing protein [Oxalicibacterium sp.]|uniref:DUF1840 domain-containing protein n=1 Tax=Oxalicibacterium sp. TaxID=2766525 RepID=UPI002CDB4639|nr:DUF1840 domain-containing protein [Oxalicibacterium sp.]HWU97153.1 DUF1840 domain-containing protein [Oxalicibacterium sp.]